MFPRAKKDHSMEKRKKEVFLVKRAKTERLRKSALVNIQKEVYQSSKNYQRKDTF